MGGLVKAANRRFVRRLSPRTRRRLAALVPAQAFAWFRRRRTDVYLVSFPKCGRTWLRVLVGRAFQQHFGLPADANLVELHRLAEFDSRVPCVLATHDDDAQWKAPEQVGRDKQQYRGTRVILLVRDPRDVIVSLYHQKRDRRQGYDGSLGEFLEDRVGGFESLLCFYDAWVAGLDVPDAVLVVRYEDLVGVSGVTPAVVADAVDFASFGNMRRLEEADAFASDKLRPRRPGDLDSYKTRRGRVGGFRNDLTIDQIARLDRLMAASDADRFGYTPGGVPA
jgi:hypothetical protein